VSSARNFALYFVETATWRLTLASACAVTSRLVPLPTDDFTTRGLLGLFALNLGACIGGPLDRRASPKALIAQANQMGHTTRPFARGTTPPSSTPGSAGASGRK